MVTIIPLVWGLLTGPTAATGPYSLCCTHSQRGSRGSGAAPNPPAAFMPTRSEKPTPYCGRQGPSSLNSPLTFPFISSPKPLGYFLNMPGIFLPRGFHPYCSICLKAFPAEVCIALSLIPFRFLLKNHLPNKNLLELPRSQVPFMYYFSP